MHLLEEKMKLIDVQLRECQKLNVEKEQLYSSFDNGKDVSADASQQILNNTASLLQHNLSFLEGVFVRKGKYDILVFVLFIFKN